MNHCMYRMIIIQTISNAMIMLYPSLNEECLMLQIFDMNKTQIAKFFTEISRNIFIIICNSEDFSCH